MGRKGIGFTLTIVVVGVILLMTALSIITLGGSSISQFFNVLQSKQGLATKCNDVAQKAQNYCDNYVATEKTAVFDESSGDGYFNASDSYSIATSYNCGNTKGGRQVTGLPSTAGSAQATFYKWASASLGGTHPTTASGNHSEVKKVVAYERTAIQENCDWTQHSPVDQYVTVNGDQVSCVTEGFVQSTTCPAK